MEQQSKLATIRKAKPMSQLKLSELTGIPNQTLSKYEKGERDINKAQGITLYKIASALGCSIEDILEI